MQRHQRKRRSPKAPAARSSGSRARARASSQPPTTTTKIASDREHDVGNVLELGAVIASSAPADLKCARMRGDVAAELGRVDASRAVRGRGRSIVDDLDDAARPRRHHDHAVGEEHRFRDAVRDEQHGLAAARAQMRSSSRFIARASSRRARRRARPSGAATDRAPARGRCRRAAACRPRARSGIALEAVEPDQLGELARAPLVLPRSRRCISIGSITLSSTVRQGSSTGAWNTMPTSRLGPSTGRPRSSTSPLVRRSRPARILSSVLLPQPLGPTTVTNSPSSMAKLASVSARMSSPSRVR